MLNRIFKKIAVRLLAAVLTVSSVPAVNLITGSSLGVETVYAADGVYRKLMSLKAKYPQGAYWNHVVPGHEAWQNCYNEAYADSVTWSPCATHGWVVGAGTTDCNYFDGGWQCCGFARKIFYDLYRERESHLFIKRGSQKSRHQSKCERQGDRSRKMQKGNLQDHRQGSGEQQL